MAWHLRRKVSSVIYNLIIINPPDPTVEVQGINDLGIAVMATLGAFLPAPLMSWPGWAGSNLLGGGASVLLIGLVVAVWRRRVG